MLNDEYRRVIIIDQSELEKLIRNILREETQSNPDNLLTMQEVSEKFSISINTFKNKLEQGTIPLKPIYLNSRRPKFSAKEVERIINQLKQ